MKKLNEEVASNHEVAQRYSRISFAGVGDLLDIVECRLKTCPICLSSDPAPRLELVQLRIRDSVLWSVMVCSSGKFSEVFDFDISACEVKL